MTAFIFNAREVEPDQGRVGAIPAGWYATMVEKTELKPSSGGTGQLIAVTLGVIDGPNKGSKIFTNFNVVNDNEQAVTIGRKQLSALCHAVNLFNMQDTDQLKNTPFYTRVKVTPAVFKDDGVSILYEEKNEPTAYRAQNDQSAAEQAKKLAMGGAAKPAVQTPAPMQQPVQQPVYQQPVQQQQPVYQQPVQQQQPQQFQGTPQPWAQPGQVQQAAPAATPSPEQVAAYMAVQAAQAAQAAAAAAAAATPAPQAGQPDWANQAPQFAQQQPQAQAGGHPATVQPTPEQMAAFAASQSAGVPWGAPQ